MAVWNVDDLIVTRGGIATLVVCVPAVWKRGWVEAAANLKRPTGIKSQWRIRDEAVIEGQAHPAPCCAPERFKDGRERMHYVLEC